jgi:hypothetical protein
MVSNMELATDFAAFASFIASPTGSDSDVLAFEVWRGEKRQLWLAMLR